MKLERLDEWLERGILILVLGALVFAPLAFGGVYSSGFLVVQGITLLVGLLWIVRCWLKPKFRLLWPPICWAVVAFAAYAAWRYCAADLEYVARQEVIRVFVYAFLFLAVVNNLHGRECSQVISLTLIFTGMCVAGYAVYQFATGSDQVWNEVTPYKGRAPGTFYNPNSLAGFLEMLLPLGVAFTVAGRLPALGKVFIGYATLVIAAGIAVSLSRGGWIASGVSLLVFGFVLLRYPNYRIPAVVMLAVILAAGGVFLKKSAAFRERTERAAVEFLGEGNRVEIWTSAIRMWKEQPWWGVGPGHFDHRFREYRTQIVQRQPERVHNDYLNTLVDWGVAGFVIVLAAWVLLFVGVARTWAFVRGGVSVLGDRKGDKFAFVLGASCSLIAILVHSFLDFNMHIPANALLVVMLMALLSTHLRSATEQYWFGGGWLLKAATTLLIAGAIGGLGLSGWQRAKESVWLSRARQAIKIHPSGAAELWRPERISALEKAFAVEPNNFETAFEIGQAYQFRSEAEANRESLASLENASNWESATNALTDVSTEPYLVQARLAASWYNRVLNLNPYHASAHVQLGLCLDEFYEFEQAEAHIQRANELDPNGMTTSRLIGLHYLKRADSQNSGYAVALPWFVRSMHLRLVRRENLPAYQYVPICERQLVRAARLLEFSTPVQ